MATIHSIVYQLTESVDEPPYRYSRTPAEQVEFVGGHGIQGDRKAGHSPKRHLNIMDLDMAQTLQAEGYQAAPGELGEQIVIDGLDMMALEYGTRLQFGESAVIEINGPREPCEWFEKIQGKPKEAAENRIGVMATVISSGTVRVGDAVRVLETVG
jgi:MOSC domain-containing protein YiiM